MPRFSRSLLLACLWLAHTVTPLPVTRSDLTASKRSLQQPEPPQLHLYPPQRQPPWRGGNEFPIIPRVSDAEDVQDSILPVHVDGVPLPELPPRFQLVAFFREKWHQTRSGTPSPAAADAPERRKHLRTATDIDASAAYCTTDECVQMMKEYEEWRTANGYGTTGGRWG